jgi:hypothetical protein
LARHHLAPWSRLRLSAYRGLSRKRIRSAQHWGEEQNE